MAGLESGELDRRIVLQKPTVSQDVAGGMVETFADQATVWAEARPPTGSEVFKAAQFNARIDRIFIIRWRSGIDPTWRVSFESAFYDIYSVSEIGRREGLMISAIVRR